MNRIKGLGMLLVIVSAACTPTAAGPGWTFTPANAGASQAPGSSQAPSTSEAPAGVLGKIEVDAIDIAFAQPRIVVPKAGKYEVKAVNKGTIGHDVTFADGTQVVVAAGETKTTLVTVPAAGMSFKCTVPGHADAGMTGEVVVEGAAASAPPATQGSPAPSGAVVADPNAAAYTLYDAQAPALLSGTVHDIDLVIEEKEMTVAPGFVQRVWTFGGTVPGPVIRVKVGDTVRIRLKNPTTSQVSHSIDFHASQVAWNDEMTDIAPGQEKVYEWKAEYAGVWMYHCGTAPALHHIANGMFGMVIVEPKAGLPKVDAEFAVVQSEWYLGPQREPVSLSKAASGAPAPDYVVFNGVASQYKDNPIQVKTGGRVRVFVLDAGPNIDSAFHVVGTIFSSVIKEGIRLVPGNDGNWGSQVMDLSPAQGGIVEFVMPEDGLYPMVTHAFNFVGRGALGLFKAGDGDPLN
ncbi:MAG: multicopper oxidase domain-containing protein [Chloroflexi bacterium]|nr:multicopper oxidase domain-containing protein [Chloroflexota bacterium]